MNDKNNSLEFSFFQSLKNDGLELALEIGEFSLDQFLDDSLIKDIPFFSIFYKSYKTAINVREALFAMKVYKFLKDFNAIKIEQKISFIDKIDYNKRERNKIGQTLLMVIDRLDDYDKTQILANLFAAYLEGNVKNVELIYLCNIVQNAYLEHLNFFLRASNIKEDLSNDVQSSLSAIGLMIPFVANHTYIYSEVELSEDRNSIAYHVSEIGRKFRKYAVRPLP